MLAETVEQDLSNKAGSEATHLKEFGLFYFTDWRPRSNDLVSLCLN